MYFKIPYLVIFTLIINLLLTQPLYAYIGPGAGLSAIGTFLALIAGLFVAVFGFIWYPIKRLFKRRKKEVTDSDRIDNLSS